jgi:hypothetical protein
VAVVEEGSAVGGLFAVLAPSGAAGGGAAARELRWVASPATRPEAPQPPESGAPSSIAAKVTASARLGCRDPGIGGLWP